MNIFFTPTLHRFTGVLAAIGIAVVSLWCGINSVSAQTTLLSASGDGGFENGSTLAANGWTGVNSSQSYYVGTATAASAGSNCAYTSTTSGSWTPGSSASVAHIYRDIYFSGATESVVTVTLKYKTLAVDGTFDFLKVHLVPTTTTPVAGTQLGSGQLGANTDGTTSYVTYTFSGAVTPNTTQRLVISFKTDAASPYGAAAIDEVSVVSSTPSTYTWVATSGSASWATAASWSPARNTPNSTDILQFTNGGSSTATGIITQTVGQIVFGNNTTTNFQSSSTATLTAGSLTIPSGSTLLSNGTSAALTLAFSSGAINSIEGRLESNNGTYANAINFTNSVTTISSTGTFAVGGTNTSTIVTSSTTTLLIDGTYEHKFTTVGGTIPTATWGASSNCNLIGYTTNTSAPSGFAQNFANFTYNCSNQSGNLNFSSSSTTGVSGTFTVTSTGTGSLRWTGTGGYIVNANNFTQTGGTFDIASGSSGTSMTFNVSGTFNQTGGSFISSGTSTNNPTLHFNGSSNQTVSFSSQPTGPITYRISNSAGITFTGPNATFSLGNGTLGGLRISTNAATPVTFAGTTTAFSYNAANSTLTYDYAGSLTATGTEFPASNGPARLTVGIGSGNVLTLPFNRTVSGILTMTSGDIDISSNVLTLGTSSSALGTLTYTAGNIRVTSGSMKRWFGTSSLPTSAGTGVGYFPLATETTNRNVSVYFSTTSALSTAGTISVGHSAVGGLSTISPSFTDGSYTVNTRTNSSWTFATGDGIAASGTVSLRLTCGGNAFSSSTPANLRVIQASAAAGSHVSGSGTSPTFQASRSGLTLLQLGQTHYIGAGTADIQLTYNAIASGDWNTASTWDAGEVPSCTGSVIIASPYTVTVSTASNVCQKLTINSGGTLTVSSGDLTVGCTLNNNTLSNSGTLTVSGGTLNINGNLVCSSGSTFNQSGGSIIVDGNAAGVTASSVATGTYLISITASAVAKLNLTGGSITIVDPHAGASTSDYCLYVSQGGAYNAASTGHTFNFGDGVSTTSGGHSNGFYYYLYPGSYYYGLGNVEVNTSTGTNRIVKPNTTYSSVISGNLTVTTGEYSSATTTYVAGNIVNNGILTHTSVLYLGTYTGTAGATTNAQTISGSGTYRNLSASPTANLNSLTVNNTNSTGVTLNLPLSVSATLTMTAGLINTTATNLLTLGTTTAVGTLSGTPSNTNMIVGPFARTFAASTTGSSTFGTAQLFPVGKGTTYQPLWVGPTTTSGGAVTFTGETFLTNSGSAGGGVTNLSSATWSAIPNATTNLTNVFVQIGETAIVTGKQILHAPTAAGAYGSTPTTITFTTGTPPTLKTNAGIATASYTGYFAYGDITPCTVPADQPTVFTAANKTTTGFSGSFTAASSAPSNYLVVRYASGATPTAPSDYTTYTVGGALGTGTVRYIGTGTTFTETGLSSGSTYDYYVYSYNNTVGCYGPAYNTTNPLSATVTTCSVTTGIPGTPTSSAVTSSSFTASWTASSTSGVEYIVDVATDAGFTSFVSGYNSLNVGTALTTNVPSLSPATTYYVRVRAVITGCFSANSSSLTVSTECNPETAPTASQAFSTYIPTCWKEATGTLAASTTLSGTSSLWAAEAGFANTGSNPAVRINLYSTKNEWVISQPIDLGATAGLFRIKYNMAVTSYLGTTAQSTLGTHKVDIVVSTDGGTTWSNTNIVKTYTGAGTYSNTGQTEYIDLTAYSGVVKIAFVATTTSTSPDIDFHIDDFQVENIPSCTGTPTGGTSAPLAQTLCSGSAPANLVVTGASSGIGISYQWQESDDNGTNDAWSNATGGSGATSTTYTPPAFGGTTIYYRLLVTCTNSNEQATSSVSSIVAPSSPGNTTASTNPVCSSGQTTTLGIQNAAPTGSTYQWQSSNTSGSGFTSISGAVSATYVATVTSNTYYRCVVTCSGGATLGTSNELLVTVGAGAPYCTPSFGYGCGSGDVITNVVTGSLSNASSCASTCTYSNYLTGLAVPNFTVSTNQSISVTVGDGGTEYVRVFVDFNQDGDFGDTGENILLGSGNNVIVTGNIPIPTNATLGITRMRVMVRFNSSTYDACYSSSTAYGETEDYTVNITPSNDNCANAVNINGGGITGEPTGVPVESSTVGATASSEPNTCGGVADDDVWFVFTTDSDGGDIVIKVVPTGGFNPVIEAFTGACGGLNSVGCVTGNMLTLANAAGSTAYYIRVYDAGTGVTGGEVEDRSAGGFTITVSGKALPVELTQFTAKALENSNLIEWTTASEHNVKTHLLEHSADGYSYWSLAGQLEGKGNSQTTQNYSLEDRHPYPITFYRLRTLDFDGSEQLSKVIAVTRRDLRFGIVNVFPNPAKESLNVQYHVFGETLVTAYIADVTGRIVSQQQIDSVNGLNTLPLNISELSSGTYFVTLLSSDQSSAPVRFVKQ